MVQHRTTADQPNQHGCALVSVRCFVDVETYSECDLKEAGAFRYAEHESTEVLVLGYAFDDGPVHQWIPYDRFDIPQAVLDGVPRRAEWDGGAVLTVSTDVPRDLRQHIESGGEVHCHNAQFEFVVLNGAAGRKLNFPLLKPENLFCTMAKCRVMGLPGALGDAAAALGTYPKMATGRNDMLAFSKPRRKEAEPRWTPENDPERFVRLCAYNLDDIKAERDIDKVLPDLNESERQVWLMDFRMNQRGVAADLESVAHAKAMIAEYKAELEAQCVAITGLKPSQTAAIAKWIRQNGWPSLVDMTAPTVARLTKNPLVPDNCRTVLKIRSTYAMTAVAKFDAIEQMACKDGRLRGMFQFYGAGPGRWTSTGVGLQNLMRPLIDDANDAIEMFPSRDLRLMKALYEVDPLKVLASCIRGMLVAA